MRLPSFAAPHSLGGFKFTIVSPGGSRPIPQNVAIVTFKNMKGWPVGIKTTDSRNCSATCQHVVVAAGDTKSLSFGTTSTTTLVFSKSTCRASINFFDCWGELPEWMFDWGACSYLNIAVALLESFVRADAQAVVEAQHHPFPSGGADARQTVRRQGRTHKHNMQELAFRRSSNTYRTKRDTIGTTRLTLCVAHECFNQGVFTSMLGPSIVRAEDTGLPFRFQPEYESDVHEGSSHRDWIRRRVREA
jgi:hypothetical protein